MATCAEIKASLQARRLPTLQCALVPSETPAENAMRLPARVRFITPYDAMSSLYAFTTTDATNRIAPSKYTRTSGGSSLAGAAATTCVDNTDTGASDFVLVSYVSSALSLQGAREWITTPDCPGGTLDVGIVKPITSPDFSLINKTTGLRYSGRGRRGSTYKGSSGPTPPTPVQPPAFILGQVTSSSTSSRIVTYTRIYMSSDGYTPSSTAAGSTGSAYIPILR